VLSKRVRKNCKKEAPEKKKAKRMRGTVVLLKLLLGIASVPLMSLLFILSHDLLTQSEYFNSEHIIVEGAERLSENQIRQQAGIEEKMNIFALNLNAARQNLMGNPWIQQAQVARELPGTIHIRIVEHEPLAVVDFGEKFILNTEGIIFKKLESNDPENLPLITGLSYSDLREADNLGSIWFLSVMEVLQLGKIPGSVLPNHLIHRIDVDRQTGLLLHTTAQNKTIKLGLENYPEKYAKLEKVISNIKSHYLFNDYSSIDLINPDRIVVYPVEDEFEADQEREA
jgi:cell division protein FtsQ